MALSYKNGGVPYTKWTHSENGDSVARRIHRLEIQARDGQLYFLDGDALPDEIHTCAGQGRIGKNLGRILLSDNPQEPTYSVSLQPNGWPSRRDLVHVIIGLVLLMMLKVGIALAAGTF